MKRKAMAWILTLVLILGLSTTAWAKVDRQERAADAMNRLDLFQGRSALVKDYDLETGLNRAEGTVLLLRMTGEEEQANRYGVEDNRFEDMKKNRLEWAVPGVAYAHERGLVKGISETEFNPEGPMQDYMFLTLVLRQLGYEDSNPGGKADFVWNKPYTLAYRVGLIDAPVADEKFTRGDAVSIAWKAMEVCYKDSKMTLSDHLLVECTFSEEEYQEARELYTYGFVFSEHSGRPTGQSTLQIEPGRRADVSGSVRTDEYDVVLRETFLVGSDVSVQIPKGVIMHGGVNRVSLYAGPTEEPGANLAVMYKNTMISYVVYLDGIAPDNEVPVVVDLGVVEPPEDTDPWQLEEEEDEEWDPEEDEEWDPEEFEVDYIWPYYIENGAPFKMYVEYDLECLDEHNEFYYDYETGHLYVALATF